MPGSSTLVGTFKHFQRSWTKGLGFQSGRAAKLNRAVRSVFFDTLESRTLLSTYYVSTGGSDSNAGTLAAPFLHIQKGLSALGSSAGTIDVEAGTYVLGDGTTNNTGGIVLPSQSGVTLANYNGGSVYIVGGLSIGSSDSSGWTQVSGNVYQTTLSGQLGYVDSGTDIATVQEIFENFSATATGTRQDALTQYGSDYGFVDINRENVLPLPSNNVDDLPSGSWYINGLSNTLYVNVGANPGTTLTAANPHVLEDLTGGGSGDVVSHLNFEISDSSGESSSSNASTALAEFEDGTGGWSDTGAAVRVASNTELLDSNVYYGALDDIELETTGCQVIGSDAYWSGCTDVITDTSNNFLIQYCNIEDSNIRNFSVEWGAGGVKIIPNCYGGTVTDCQIANSNGTGLWSDTNDTTGKAPLVFSNNYIHSNVGSPLAYPSDTYSQDADAGIKIEVSTYVQVYNNVVVANGPIGILLAGCEDCQVDNNTVSSNVGYAAILADTDGNRTDVHLNNGNDYQLANNTIENNIISHNDTTYDLVVTMLPSTVLNGTGQPLATNNLSDYNLFYRVGEPIQLSHGDPDDNTAGANTSMGSLQTSLANWTSATAGVSGGEEEDAHSIFADPLYAPSSTAWSYNQSAGTYVAGNYYILSSGSPARGRGNPSVTISNTDYQGTSRSAPYDIGAFEYNGDSGVNSYTTPTLDGEAWVDDTTPQGAIIYDPSTSYKYTSNGTAYIASTDVRVTAFNWVNSTTLNSPYEWGSGAQDGDSAIANTDAGLPTNWSNVMSFQDATQTMTISSASDSLFLYVYEASSSTGITPALTTPTEVGVSFFDQSLGSGGEWVSAYWGGTSMNGTGNVLPNAHAGSGTPAAGSWVKLSISASSLGMSAGNVISGLTLASYGGEAAFDNIGDTPAAAPVAPSNIVAHSISSTENDISWTDNSSNETGFKVLRAPLSTPTTFTQIGTTGTGTGTGSTIAYQDTSATSGTYYYEVESYNASGTSAPGTAVNSGSTLIGTQATGRTNLAGAWDFEDTIGGVLAQDSSGDGNTGTLQVGATLAAASGETGAGLSVNGTTGFVSAPSSSSLAAADTAMTIEAWVYVSSSGTANYSGIDKDGSYGLLALTSPSDPGAPSTASATSPAWEFYINNVATGAVSTTTTAASGWYFITGTWGGAEPRIWINNVVEGSVSYSTALTVNSNPFEIGRGQGADYFHGFIDEVQVIMGRELSNAEITQDYDDGGGSIHAAITRKGVMPNLASPTSFSSTPIASLASIPEEESIAQEIGLASSPLLLS